MGEKTDIAWCDSTFSPWIGCQKVSPGCDNCYAEALMDKRWGKVQWGPHGERKRTSDANWRQPITWNKHFAAFQAKHGHRQRVFCSSLADVFDNQVPEGWRADLFALIMKTPELDWLLLTKRPENIARMMHRLGGISPAWPNVWLGFTAEDQANFDRRWKIMREIPAAVRFCSYEPAIGPLRLWRKGLDVTGLHWTICGGESGRDYRTFDPQWARDVMDDCAQLGVAFFMKQMAGVTPAKIPIPDHLMVRQFPQPREGTTL